MKKKKETKDKEGIYYRGPLGGPFGVRPLFLVFFVVYWVRWVKKQSGVDGRQSKNREEKRDRQLFPPESAKKQPVLFLCLIFVSYPHQITFTE